MLIKEKSNIFNKNSENRSVLRCAFLFVMCQWFLLFLIITDVAPSTHLTYDLEKYIIQSAAQLQHSPVHLQSSCTTFNPYDSQHVSCFTCKTHALTPFSITCDPHGQRNKKCASTSLAFSNRAANRNELCRSPFSSVN